MDTEREIVVEAPAPYRMPSVEKSRYTPTVVAAEERYPDVREAYTAEPTHDNGAILLGNPELDDEDPIVTTPMKRKRISTTKIDYILDDSTYSNNSNSNTNTNSNPNSNPNSNFNRDSPADEPRVKRRPQGPKVRGVIIGVWRDSDQPNNEEKHVIYGFIDIHDRLRTRIYALNRHGEELIGNVPTGAGGCWVTFERIIFDSHLRNLSTSQVKEYVKIRSATEAESTPEERQDAEAKAVLRAISLAAEHGTPDVKPVQHRRVSGKINRSSGQISGAGYHDSLVSTPLTRVTPRQPTLHKVPSFQAVNANISTPKAAASPLLPESKSSGVLLGFWADSDQVRDEDKHAVCGVLSENDSFRVKVQRLTRDGRHVDGNYPAGTGAMWIPYDKLVLDSMLQDLSRPQIKEYCRMRQRDLEHRESDKERHAHEARAVQAAKSYYVPVKGPNGMAPNPFEQYRRADAIYSHPIPQPGVEVRHSSRSEQKHQARQQAEADAEAAARARQEHLEARERQNEQSRREIAANEALIQERAQQELRHNIKKLNKVWVAQKSHGVASPSGGGSVNGVNGGFAGSADGSINDGNGARSGSEVNGEGVHGAMNGGTNGVRNGNMNGNGAMEGVQMNEVRFYNGIKYERKTYGPWAGKLVSSTPQLIQIDGDDYVEYRVLTKPNLF